MGGIFVNPNVKVGRGLYVLYTLFSAFVVVGIFFIHLSISSSNGRSEYRWYNRLFGGIFFGV